MNCCFACLSTDRTLTSLGPYVDVCAELFINILKDLNQLWVCWECKAKLKSIKCFKKQVEQANETMNHYVTNKAPLATLSRLTVSKPKITSIDDNTVVEYKYEEPKIIDEPKVKQEIVIEVVENLKEEAISDQEITYDDCIDDIPLEQIFQTQIKEEKNKRKRIKKNKTKPTIIASLWDMKKPQKVKISRNKIKEWLDIERRSSYFQQFIYKCEHCAMGYVLKKSWDKHQHLRHNEKNPHICNLCHRTFPNTRKLETHKMDHNHLWQCRDCSFSSIIKHHMQWHLEQEHPGDNKYLGCDYCLTKFSSSKQIERHMFRSHREFTCDECGHKSITKRRIEMHIKDAHGPRFCTICKKTFKNHRNLKYHIQTLHTVKHDESSYCVQCDIQFDNSILFRRHVNSSVKHKVEVRGDVPKKTYPCSVCGKVYQYRYGMRNHYRLVHLKATKYYCEECDLYLLNRTSYLRHVNKHRGIQEAKNKFCDICGRGFHTNRILINHIRTHTGERPHECPHCDAKFAQLTAMKSHVKHIHMKVERRRQFLA